MTDLPLSDAQLVELMAAGDRRAHEQLSHRHRLSLYARVYALLADPAATEEVLSETLERAWRAARHFNPGAGSAANVQPSRKSQAVSLVGDAVS